MRVVISKVPQEEFALASDYVLRKYQKEYGTVPQIKPTDNCFVAKKDGKIIGFISVEFSKGEGLFLEKIYAFEPQCSKELLVSIGRFVADIPDIGFALAFVAVRYSVIMQREFALCCSKPNILELFRRRYGLNFEVLDNEICQSQVADSDRAFFSTHPLPRLYFCNLRSLHDILKEKVPPWVTFEITGF